MREIFSSCFLSFSSLFSSFSLLERAAHVSWHDNHRLDDNDDDNDDDESRSLSLLAILQSEESSFVVRFSREALPMVSSSRSCARLCVWRVSCSRERGAPP